MKGTTICHRNGKANGESNKEEQAEDVQVVAHLSWLMISRCWHNWVRPKIKKKRKIPAMTSFDKFDWDGTKMENKRKIQLIIDNFVYVWQLTQLIKNGTEMQDTHFGFFQQVRLRDLPEHDLLHNKDGDQKAWWGQAKDSDVIPWTFIAGASANI